MDTGEGFFQSAREIVGRALKGHLSHAENRIDTLRGYVEMRITQIALEVGDDLAVLRYFINEDTSYWVFDTMRFEAHEVVTHLKDEQGNLNEPFVEKYGYICCPRKWLVEHGKRVIS